MKKVTIDRGNTKYKIYLEHYKIILGSNEYDKFEMIRSFLKLQSNIKPSEYSVMYNNLASLSVDDVIIRSKDCYISFVHKYYSLIEDMKLNTKSLITKYLDVLFAHDDYKDTLNTINLLFESLQNEVSDNSLLSCEFHAMVSKQLLKIVTPKYLVDDLVLDEYDLSLEDIVLFQLELIDFISKHTFYAHCFVCVELANLTPRIFEKIKEMEKCSIFLFVDRIDFKIPLENIALCERVFVDLANEEDLYYKICDNRYRLLSLEEGRDYMKAYLYEEGSEKQRFIKKIIS